ncbi:MAG: amino acid adenylation domain-containing protein [Coleofasciculaceae cyanobacterium SM2_1_6]|nr:amino acid adenylation domain-containing protein [Coleofasciculaceae cyanobacterium SM2_1_6]
MVNQLSYAVSPLQRAMLLPSLVSQNSGIYLEQVILYCREDLDKQALKESWQQVTRAYEILRTYFDWQSSTEIRQIIAPEVNILWQEFDWSSLSLGEQKQKIAEYLERDRSQGFHLDQPPLMRFALCKLGDNSYQLIWTFHHSILDGRSIILLLKEVFACYQAHQQDYIHQLPSVTPYRKFIEFIDNQLKDNGRQFWQDLLVGFTNKNNLSAQNIQGSLKAFSCIRKKIGRQLVEKYNSYKINLSSEITAKLQTLATDNNFTLNNLIQGVYALALGQCSGSSDIVFGATRACRRLAIEQVETMLGLLINTIPVRVQINPELTLIQLCQELRSQWVAMRDYETTSLAKIHQWSELESGQNLFDTLVVFENCDLTEALDLPNCQVEIKEQTDLPLSLTAYSGRELSLLINYDLELYNSTAIALFLTYITELLKEFCLVPHAKVKDIQENIFQKHQLTFLDLFTQQVRANPQQLAVVSQNHDLTYQQLENQSNFLALRLREAGVKAEVLVGICGERSLEMIIGILAILKAGGAYVPMDPNYPLERIKYILQDTQTPILLTQSWLSKKLPEFSGIVIYLDEYDSENQDIQNIQNIQVNPLVINSCPKPAPEDLAYIIYTSGSTGNPKGVMIEHRALAEYVLVDIQEFGLQNSDRLLQFAAVTFDLSVAEIFPCLASGSTLYLRTEEMAASIPSLLAKCQEWQITCLNLPTAFWHYLVDQLITNNWQLPPSLRLIMIGGERVHKQRVSLWLDYVGHYPHLVNAYGPTEATVIVTTYWISGKNFIVNPQEEIPIGQLLPHVKGYILDPEMQPVDDGLIGELYLHSLTLARGYLNRPDLTVNNFVNLNLAGKPIRCYKTGDRVTRLPDGNLLYLDRIDRQVKIRGYRIELGETEAVLRQYSSVQDAVVVAQEKNANNLEVTIDKYLVGYIVPWANQEINLGELQEFLKACLPQYMIPRTIMVLATLPISTNGKIAYSLLPIPEFIPDFVTIEAPRNDLETLLVKIWQEVFQSPVGIRHNFWELGGDSLKAMQVISQLYAYDFGKLSIQNLFTYPTIAELAQYFQGNFQDNSQVNSTPELIINPDLIKTARSIPATSRKLTSEPNLVRASIAQERLWLLAQFHDCSGAYHVQMAWQIRGDLNLDAWGRSLEQILDRHSSLRTNFQLISDQVIQVIHPTIFNKNLTQNSSLFTIEKLLTSIDLCHLSSEEQKVTIDQLLLNQQQQNFNLAEEALLRMLLIKVHTNKYIFAITLHHIITDGWSMGIFQQELSSFYQSQSAIPESPISTILDLPIQYQDFAVWERESYLPEIETDYLSYWQQKLANFPPHLELPSDRSRSTVSSYVGNSYHHNLNPELSKKIKEFSRNQQVTLFMTLLSSFITFLYRCTAQTDFVVGVPIANRPVPEVANLIGYFLNTIPLRCDLSGNPQFQELLARIKTNTTEAYAYPYVPFEQLRAAGMQESEWFRVVFILIPSITWEIPSLEITEYKVTKPGSTVDLTLYLEEIGEEIAAVWEYRSELFEAETIQFFALGWISLLEDLIDTPETQINQDYLWKSDTYQSQKLIVSNSVNADNSNIFTSNLYSESTKTINELFLEQVISQPQAIAVSNGVENLTYQGLYLAAAEVAKKLIALGVKPDTLVGICGDRSLEVIIGIMGVLLAGGAYVPIDPKYPLDRINFILADTQTPVLLTQSHLLPKLTEVKNQVICLDQLDLGSNLDSTNSLNSPNFPEQLLLNNSNICSKPEPNSLGYVIYTSGSTGKPKGVMIEHGSLGNFVQVATAEYEIKKSDHILQFSSLSFDIAVEEIFLSLGNGGSLYLRTPDMASSIALLLEKCQTWGITILDLSTAYWHQLVEILAAAIPPQGQLPPSLRLVIVGGEKMEKSRAILWQKLVGNYPLLVNTYGPTEATVIATTQWINGSQGVEDLTAEIPIGYPLPGMETYILNEAHQLVAPGTVGELYLGGVSLARGYWQSPDLTAKKFLTLNIVDNLTGAIDDHSGAGQARRLYQTGDLVQQLPDRRLLYLGRTDYREKIGGFLVELAEVETTLQQHPQVKDVVVIVKDPAKDSDKNLGINYSSSEKYLVAFVVLRFPKGKATPTPTELPKLLLQLQDWLRSKLPQYLVPRFYQILDQLPLTVNGKIDRPALQNLPLRETVSLNAGSYSRLESRLDTELNSALKSALVVPVPPSALEKKLLSIWQQVLGNKQIGVEDNFFQLGGSSLVALRLFSLIEQEFQRNLPLTILIQAPTIRQLAALLQSQGWRVSWRSLVPIQTQGSKTPIFCIHPIGGNVLCYENLLPYLSPDQPVYGLQAQGLDGVAEAIDDIKIMARNYLQEIQTIQPHSPYILAGYSFGGIVAYEIAQQLRQAGEEVAALIFLDVISPQLSRAGVPPIAQRLAIHGANLAQLDTAQRLAYFSNRIGKKVTNIQDKLHQYFDRMLGKQDLTTIPAYLKKLETAHNQAACRYAPNFYHGRVIQFQAIERPANIYPSPSLGWQEVVKNPVEIIKGIPGHHGTMLEPPQVAIVGEKLQRILNNLHLR